MNIQGEEGQEIFGNRLPSVAENSLSWRREGLVVTGGLAFGGASQKLSAK